VNKLRSFQTADAVLWLAAAGAMLAGWPVVAALAWLALGASGGLPGACRWLQQRSLLAGARVDAPLAADAATQALISRLDEAARTWTAHLATAQTQLRDAT